MLCKNNKDVVKIVRDRNVSFIQIWFTDVLGMLKSFAITPSELEGALTEGMGFDGSSIEGFARIEESDMIAKPDPTTFQFVPWRPKDRPVARMFCDILQTKARKSLTRADILIRRLWISGQTCEEKPFSPSRRWEFRWSTVTTKLLPVSMKLICATTRD